MNFSFSFWARRIDDGRQDSDIERTRRTTEERTGRINRAPGQANRREGCVPFVPDICPGLSFVSERELRDQNRVQKRTPPLCDLLPQARQRQHAHPLPSVLLEKSQNSTTSPSPGWPCVGRTSTSPAAARARLWNSLSAVHATLRVCGIVNRSCAVNFI